MKPQYLNNKDRWMLAENIPDCDIFFFQIPASCFTNNTSYPFILKYQKFIATYEKFEQNFYYGEKNSFAVAESIIKALLTRPNFGQELNSNIASLMVESPDSFWARVVRAHRFAEQGNWSEAELLLKRLLQEAPAESFVIELADAVVRRAELPSIEKLPIEHF